MSDVRWLALRQRVEDLIVELHEERLRGARTHRQGIAIFVAWQSLITVGNWLRVAAEEEHPAPPPELPPNREAN
jgi:hypothetical protein